MSQPTRFKLLWRVEPASEPPTMLEIASSDRGYVVRRNGELHGGFLTGLLARDAAAALTALLASTGGQREEPSPLLQRATSRLLPPIETSTRREDPS